MPHFCPHCNTEMADDSVQCPHCGQPRTESSFQDLQAERDRRFPFWTILPWTLLAAAALFFLPHLLRSSQGGAAASQRHTAPAVAAPAAVSAPVPITPAEVPLTVVLSTASDRRHVPVGTPVMISAYASLPPGQSATLAISYSKDDEPKTLLALAQGTLTSAAWVPAAPGRYRFTASVLDSHKNGAFSHHLTFTAVALPVPAPAKQAPAEIAAVEPPALSRTTAKRSAPKPLLRAAAASKPRSQPQTPPQPYHVQPYHVAAASFRIKRIADTLAGALRQRGFHAFVRPNASGQYRVETGDFVRRADAQKQIQLLQRDGYPSYMFQTH